MTCNACGLDLPLADKRTCVQCYNEGPFTRADREARWVPHFAWWPTRITYRNRLVWLRRVEVKEYHCFGPNRFVRLAQEGISDG